MHRCKLRIPRKVSRVRRPRTTPPPSLPPSLPHPTLGALPQPPPSAPSPSPRLLGDGGLDVGHDAPIPPGGDVCVRHVLDDGDVAVDEPHALHRAALPHAVVPASTRALQGWLGAWALRRRRLHACSEQAVSG